MGEKDLRPVEVIIKFTIVTSKKRMFNDILEDNFGSILNSIAEGDILVETTCKHSLNNEILNGEFVVYE